MTKEKVNELLNYTKSKKILRVVFLYNNDEILDKIIEIYKKLYNTNRSDSEKSDLVMLYIRNRKKDHIEYVICNSQMTNNYTFKEQKVIINKFVSSKISFEEVVNNCYLRIVNNDATKEENELKKEHKKDKQVIKITSLITRNKNVLEYRRNQEIYELIKIYYSDEQGISLNIIINESVLKYRNNYEQIVLIKKYLDYPFNNVYNLIVSSNILRNTSLHEQLKMIDMYLDNQSTETYIKIINSALKKDPCKDLSKTINKDVKKYKNILFKKENK